MSSGWLPIWGGAWWLALAMLGLGIGVLIRGWKARYLDDHPLCDKCGYDLFGLALPAHCPECDTSTRQRRVKIGHRTRHKPMLRAGTLMIVLGVAGLWGFDHLHDHLMLQPYRFRQAIQNNDLAEVDRLLKINPTLAVDWSAEAHGYRTASRTPALFALAVQPDRKVLDRILQEPIDINDVKTSSFPTTLLGEAVQANDTMLVESLLMRGADPDQHFHHMFGLTPPLHRATAKNNLPMVQLLLHHGADPKIVDERGAGALHVAAGNWVRPQIIDWLVKKGADIHQADPLGRTPTHWAAGSSQNDRVLPAVLAAGGDILGRDHDGLLPGQTNVDHPGPTEDDYRVEVWWRHIIKPKAAAGDWQGLRGMFDAAGDIKHWRNRHEGFTLLHHAIEQGDLEHVHFLIDYGFDLNAPTTLSKSKGVVAGRTPLHIAVAMSADDIVKVLLHAGADATLPDEYGRTPLAYATANNDQKIADAIQSTRSSLDDNR